MKKIKRNFYVFSRRRQALNLKKEKRIAGFRKQRIKIFTKKLSDRNRGHSKYHEIRIAFRKDLYKRYKYKNAPRIVKIDGELGIETHDIRKRFLEVSSDLIDFDNREILLDLSNCTRVWPSAVTLLCSLIKWIELCCLHRKIKPKIASNLSNDHKVNSYLYHCGFNEYVGLKNYKHKCGYSENQVVKIKRELNHVNIEDREDEIVELLKRNSALDNEQIEWFNSVILTEIFINVSEHGVSLRDQGWWLLAQHHEKHGLISISIADNGIGIFNNLKTGPQWEQIKMDVPPEKSNEGDYIRHAMKQNVSGAIQAQIKERGLLRSKYPIGSKRGNGLSRILEKCKDLGIELSILSHHGYLFYDSGGQKIDCGAMENRVFAGTMYHLSIPARRT